MNKKSIFSILVSTSVIMIASVNQDLAHKITKNPEYQKLHASWKDVYSKVVALEKKESTALQQLHQPQSQIYSIPGYLNWCYLQHSQYKHQLKKQLNKMTELSSCLVEQIAMQHRQENIVCPSSVVDSGSGTTQEPTNSRSSYAQVVKKSQALSLPRSRTNSSSTLSDLTVSLDSYSELSKTSHRHVAISDKGVQVALDPVGGITKLQAFSRGWIIRNNLAARQRQLIYEKEKLEQRMVTPNLITASLSSDKSDQKKMSSCVIKSHKARTKKSTDDELIAQAIKEEKQNQFFIENPELHQLIIRHADHAAQKASPQTKKHYPMYVANESAIEERVVTPWTVSWMRNFSEKMPNLGEKELEFCHEKFTSQLKTSLQASYRFS